MSDMAKQARAAMKAKAKSLTSADPHQKVDSSTWSPPEALNADIKTGLRPLSRRAFKAGGKVQGAKAKMNLGKASRGSNKPITPDTMANKDVKAANMDRPGIKHVGGMKKGGRACRDDGGRAPSASLREAEMSSRSPSASLAEARRIMGTSSVPQEQQERQKMTPDQQMMKMKGEDYPVRPEDARRMRDIMNRKSGGRTKKADGGDLSQYGAGVAGAAEMMKKAGARAGVPQGLYGSGFSRLQRGSLSPLKAAGMKKGGEAHPDEKMDIALIKKMVKPSARKGKNDGGRSFIVPDEIAQGATKVGEATRNAMYSRQYRDHAQKAADANYERALSRGSDWARKSDEADIANRQASYAQREADRMAGETGYDPADAFSRKRGGKAARKGRATGGEVFSGPSYPGKIPGVVPGGREARATGGKTRGKGKTNINIVIAAGKPAGQGDMMPPGGPTPPPGGMPIPVPPPQGAGAAPMPMPIPMPMPAAGGAPAGGPPTPRKSGGRLTKVASSYKDMEAGAGGGEGRLQKTDIAKKHKDAPAFRRGGKAYRSYKDIDAGAGSGLGRLEKTEIQARKG